MKRLVPCLLVLATFLLRMSAPAHTAPPPQGPTPPATQAQVDALLEECADHYNRSDFRGALEKCQAALPLYGEIGDQAGEATTLYYIGESHRALFDYEQALASYQQSLPIWQKMGDQNGEATTLYLIGLVSNARSDYREALTYFQQALPIWQEIGDQEQEARTLNSIGALHRTLSDYEQALAYLQQALPIRQEIGDRYGEAVTLNNIGLVHRARSDYQQALAYYQQALDIHQEIGVRYGEATTLNNIGAVYEELSDYEQALAYYQQALDIFREIGVPGGEAMTLNNIGAVHHAHSDYDQALTTYQQALDIRQEIGDRAGEAATLNNIGAIYSDLSDYEQARAYYQQALDIWQKAGDRAREAATLNNIGRIYHVHSDHEQALAYHEQARSIQQEIGDRAGETTTLNNLAHVHEAMGQENRALACALQAIDVLETIHSELKAEALKTAFAASTASHYHDAVRLLLAQGQADEAFGYAERGRARTFLTLLGNQRVDPKGGEDRDLAGREAQLRGELAALERQLLDEWSKPVDQRSQQVVHHVTANLEACRQTYQEILTQLQLSNPEYAALFSVAPFTLEQAQALLQDQAPDVTLLAYFVGDEQTVIFALGPETFHAQAVPVTRQELRHQVEALRAQMKAAPMLPDAWQGPAQALHEWLVRPVQAHLPLADPEHPLRLGIVPHDLLHYLPFGLLHDGEHILLDGYTIFYAPSVSSLRFIFDKRHPQPDTLLAFANPDVPGAPHLHHAVEGAQAAAILYGSQPLIGPDATEGRFKTQAGNYGLVHLAAHGDYNPHSPLFSAILLQADERDDGRLETHEVMNLDLPHTDLVVLSACQTHLGELSGGDELVGLERAFVRAGAPSLLTTLWSVDDAATAVLVERFYTHLRAGMPKAEALRQAQMETRAENPAPYYWAAFVLMGDCGPGVEKRPAWLPWAGLSCGAGLCGCAGLAILLGGAAAFWWQHQQLGSRRENTG